MGVFELISFLGPAILSALFKLLGRNHDKHKLQHERELALIDRQLESRQLAMKADHADNAFDRAWRTPVRPIITYIGFFVFFSLPFIPALLGANVSMEVCQPQTGFFAWLLGQEEAICNYITLGPNITWTSIHSTVVLMIGGFWFGDKMIK